VRSFDAPWRRECDYFDAMSTSMGKTSKDATFTYDITPENLTILKKEEIRHA